MEHIELEKEKTEHHYIKDVDITIKLRRITSYLIDLFTIFIAIIMLNLIDKKTFQVFNIEIIASIVGVVLIIILLNSQSFLLLVFKGRSPGTIFNHIEFINTEGKSLQIKDYLLKILLGTIIWIIPFFPLLNLVKIMTSKKGQSYIDEKLNQFIQATEEQYQKESPRKIFIIGIPVLIFFKLIEITNRTFLTMKYNYEVLELDSIIPLMILICTIIVVLELSLNRHLDKTKKDQLNGNLSILIGLFMVSVTGTFNERIFSNIMCLLISFIGLILGIKALKSKDDRMYGIILNSFSLMTSIITIVITIIYMMTTPTIRGTWYCDLNTEITEVRYSIYMHLYNDKTFYIHHPKLSIKNSLTGTYIYNQISKDKYNLKLNINFEELKELNINTETINYEIQLDKNKLFKNKSLIMKDIVTSETYSCEKIDY